MQLFIPVFGLILPFFALLVEKALPYPFIVEEILKGSLLFLLSKKNNKTTERSLVILIGVTFALTETAIYSINILLTSGITGFLLRLVMTSILHTATVYTTYSFWKTNKYLGVVGLLLAMLLHYFYNARVAI